MDAHPWQLLLLAVSGCGTTAGQDDTQGSWRDRNRFDSQSGESDRQAFGSARKKKQK